MTLQGRVEQNAYAEQNLSADEEYWLNKADEYDNDGVHYQSAMYKSPQENFNDFYNQVFEKENESKANGTKIKKSYFEYSDDNVYVRVKHDAVNHGDKKHQLSAKEWENILENITNIENADYSKKEYSNDKVALMKINTPMGKYGVAIQFANGTNQISTVFKSTDKGIDEWIKKGSANSSTSEPLTSRDKTHTVAVVSQNPSNIIPQILEKITSNQANVKEHEVAERMSGDNTTQSPKNINFQSMTHEELLSTYLNQEFGMNTQEITDMVKEDVLRIMDEAGVNTDEFNYEDIRVYGSYSKGTNKKGSDLDLVVQYSGNMKEDKPFNEQPKKVQDTLLKLFNDVNVDIQGLKEDIEKLEIEIDELKNSDDYDYDLNNHKIEEREQELEKLKLQRAIKDIKKHNYTGKGVYRALSEIFGSDKSASEKLNEYGIKGITYDGVQDGRCYVIFDDKAVNVLQTYYQAMIPGIDGKQEVDVVDLTSQFATDSKLTKKDLSNYIQTLIKTQPISSKDKKALFSFVKRSKRVGKKDVYIPDHVANSSKVETQYQGERNTAVNNITDLLQNSVLIDIDKNRDVKGKPNVDNYLRFYVPVKIGDDVYTVRISAENNSKRNIFNILNADVYDVIIDKKMSTSALIPDNNQRSLMKSTSNNNIPQNEQKITIEDMLKDVEDPDGRLYFQEGEQANSTEEGIKNARGFTYEVAAAGVPNGTQSAELADSVKNMIVLLKNKKDKSTYIHEFAHVYLNVLNRLAKTNSKAQDRLNTINKWLRYDGRGEYTRAQHEKFANGFVAYIKQGKAPTYGLKRAFEHFKKWLNDIYVALDNHSEFIMDSEAKAVFDEILGGTEHDKQLQKGIELYNKAITYAGMRVAKEAENEVLKQKELTNDQRRCRDIAYDILYYALSNHPEGKKIIKDRNQMIMILGSGKAKRGYKRKRAGILSQYEKIEQILLECGDVFSAHDAFLPEWGEFFSPLSDTYTDEDLARDALDCIENEGYLQPYRDDIMDSQFGGELTEKEILETQYQLEYIINAYKNAEDKTIPLLAYNEFHVYVHPYIQEDIEKQWESATAEIDRYQSLSQIQQAKEDLKLYAAALKGHGDWHGQYIQYVNKILDKLDFMTVEDKRKILEKIKEFKTFRDIERNLDDVMDYAETIQAMAENRLLSDDIQREVKQTIHEWKNGIKRTKYTYPANKLFERLREINRMTQDDAQYLYDEYVNEESAPDYTSDDVNSEDYYNTIERMFVQYKANGMRYNPTEFLSDLLNRIQNAKFTAKVARDEMDFERRMNEIHYVDKCAQALNQRKSEINKNDKIKFLADLNAIGFNFNGALRMIFNDDIKNWASLDYLYALRDGQVGKDRKDFLDKAKTIFGFVGKKGDIQLQSKLIDMTKPEFTITQRHSPDIEKGNYRVTETSKESGKTYTVQNQQVRLNQSTEIADEWRPIEVQLSRMQVLYYYIQAKNPTSWAILTDDEKGQFKRGDFENLLEELTPEEKLLGDLMQLSAEKYWDALNAYHIKKYHVELGKVRNYFPRMTENKEVNMVEMFNDFTQYTGNGKFQKQRTAGPGTRIAPANALAVLFDHMERANTIVIMGEHLDLINKVFKNPDLKRLIENTWGEKVSREFYGQLTGNLFSGQTIQQSLQESMFGKVVGNLVKTNLFLKPQIGIKQIISFMNYGKGDEYVSAGEWFKAFAKQTFTPSEWKKNIEFMMSNEYMADRFSRGGSMDALKKQLENRFFSKLSLLDEFWGMPIALGDISAIILGGKPYIDVLMNKGYSKEEAFKIFIETTVNDQQSSIPSTLSNAQRNAAKQPFSKMFFAYQNTPWQYYRQCTSAIMNAVQSKKPADIKRAGKMVVLYGWFFPAIFNMVSSLSLLALIAGGDDDDLLNDINPLRTLTSLLTQHPIFGELINGILNAVDGKQFYSKDLLSKHVKSVNKLIRDVNKDGITLKDVWDVTCAFVEPSTGLPVGSAGNAVSGVYDMTQGDFLKGTLKALGYSDYRAKTVTGEE